ncbi:PepSY-associated TM helix domain-containing protein [Marinobacter xestospongiae]|uniref:PepSY-associated TM helix domain-containing protein n=1 Tax=Marinobacter xestospongiae TaxID=994319 RepID=A0ABU3VYG3_9GAMM|nr:PepSY-associated TM helix domain-containing protein [Marinobacter xestospongiae]MDV2079320.1 PepSY-associated TM helix domain-containing protein [Marinobacter xestospongiae]
MKNGFRASMAWLHTWTGLVVGWVLFFIFVTGTAGYFTFEITHWMEPERPAVQPVEAVDTQVALATGLQRLQQVAPEAKLWRVSMPQYNQRTRQYRELEVNWESLPPRGRFFGQRGSETLDLATGQPVQQPEARETGGGNLLYRMHYAFHYMPRNIAFLLVGVCTMLMLVAIVSGVITHKKIFKDFFTFRPGKGQRSWLDAHNIISVMALPFFLMITYSGLIFFTETYMPAGIHAIYADEVDPRRTFFDEIYDRVDKSWQPVALPDTDVSEVIAEAERQWGAGQIASLTFSNPDDEPAYIELSRLSQGKVVSRVSDTEGRLKFDARTGELLPLDEGDGATYMYGLLISLHEGHFAGPALRWLYFASGLLGCGMIATGLVLWTVKRRERHARAKERQSAVDRFGLRLVEALNIATIAGLPLAVAAYFLANRLLPLDIADRADWEAHCMFFVWGWTLIYALFRPMKQAWLELFALAALAYASIPLVNAATTGVHLGWSIPQGDWVMAGFDLTMLLLAAMLAYTAHKLRLRWLKKEQQAMVAGAAAAGGAS